jgi:hypothetical protein
MSALINLVSTWVDFYSAFTASDVATRVKPHYDTADLTPCELQVLVGNGALPRLLDRDDRCNTPTSRGGKNRESFIDAGLSTTYAPLQRVCRSSAFICTGIPRLQENVTPLGRP